MSTQLFRFHLICALLHSKMLMICMTCNIPNELIWTLIALWILILQDWLELKN